MSKQIYIDENGNELLVSGTINTADMLPISANPTTNTKAYIDNVVISGSNTNGNYIKYSDGTMICTKIATATIPQNSWSAWGNCYESGIHSFGDFAETFYATPVVSLTISGSACWLETLFDQSTTSVGKSRLVRPSIPGADLSIFVQVIAVGRWKA